MAQQRTQDKPHPIAATRHVDHRGAPFIVREAVVADAARVLRHSRSVIGERLPGIITQPGEFRLGLVDEREHLARLAASPTDAMFVAVRPRGALLGVLRGTAGDRARLAHVWTLGMTVGRRWRGTGVGRALLLRAIEWVRAHPLLRRLELTVAASNVTAFELYRAVGFVEEGRRTARLADPRGNGFDDELLMAIVFDKPRATPRRAARPARQ